MSSVWSPPIIPLFGIMMIIAGSVLLKNSYRLWGKIFLFSGISLIAVSAIALSFLMPWGGQETKATIKDVSYPFQEIQRTITN